ncbi:hypothetical protein J6590_014977 [Homalodisca vitripennis]|nr:hypothetical protein J6590_014977 [Homalodisca vitripennis]
MVSYGDGIDEKNSFSPPVGLEDWPPLVPSEQRMVSYSDGIDEKNSFSPPVGLEDWPPLVPSEQR